MKAEVMINPTDMARGMMFRDTLPGRPRDAVHPRLAEEPSVLDVPGEDSAGYRLDGQEPTASSEMAENAPPCKTARRANVPTTAANRTYSFVLELPGGYARKHGFGKATVLQF